MTSYNETPYSAKNSAQNTSPKLQQHVQFLQWLHGKQQQHLVLLQYLDTGAALLHGRAAARFVVLRRLPIIYLYNCNDNDKKFDNFVMHHKSAKNHVKIHQFSLFC